MLVIYDLPNPKDYLSGLKRMISFRAKFTHNRKNLFHLRYVIYV